MEMGNPLYDLGMTIHSIQVSVQGIIHQFFFENGETFTISIEPNPNNPNYFHFITYIFIIKNEFNFN